MSRVRPRLAQRPAIRSFLAAAVVGYLGLIGRSGRWRLDLDPETEDLLSRGEPVIGAFWHGRMALLPHAWRAAMRRVGRDPRTRAVVLNSRSGEGALMAEMGRRLGLGSVGGSTRKGGASAWRGLRRVLVEERTSVAMTPDGPRGPRQRAQAGVVHLARAAQVPVMPFAFSSSRHVRLTSWDRFALPLPLDRGAVAFGAPLRVPATAEDSELPAYARELEERMDALHRALDAEFGREPVEPAARPGSAPPAEAALRATPASRS